MTALMESPVQRKTDPPRSEGVAATGQFEHHYTLFGLLLSVLEAAVNPREWERMRPGMLHPL